MKRKIEFAVHLLGFIERNDHEGIGLYREELRQLFENDPISGEVAEDQTWVVVDYHLRLLETAGFVTREADIDGKIGEDNFELTWAGHEFFEKNAPSHFSGDLKVRFL
ncbi:hypothetical protein JIQ88_01410 [Pseudomonas sp. PCH44]|uniref:hypothetical protein n=1 Tax=Pseudomonas sp. PCH44 TaxID=2800904 RepID=UPI001BAFE620|nr:hypothetical protein [Pseudomonas sp. PCH44]MBS3183737.1 hypothetical protein [Pseudomonas sp. PCH44]